MTSPIEHVTIYLIHISIHILSHRSTYSVTILCYSGASTIEVMGGGFTLPNLLLSSDLQLRELC